jgi:uncharacterized coiled-coil DUF342 family protein
MSHDPARPSPPGPQADPVREQFLRLQEALVFADRRIDQLNDEVIEATRRLDDALRRLAKLEGRVESLANPPETSDGDAAEDRDPA